MATTSTFLRHNCPQPHLHSHGAVMEDDEDSIMTTTTTTAAADSTTSASTRPQSNGPNSSPSSSSTEHQQHQPLSTNSVNVNGDDHRNDHHHHDDDDDDDHNIELIEHDWNIVMNTQLNGLADNESHSMEEEKVPQTTTSNSAITEPRSMTVQFSAHNRLFTLILFCDSERVFAPDATMVRADGTTIEFDLDNVVHGHLDGKLGFVCWCLLCISTRSFLI